jgi:adenylate kinase
MTRRIVALTGLSGVGKSTLLRTLAASVPFEHFQASALIREGRAAESAALSSDQLRLADIDENQQLLIRGFKVKASTNAGLIVLDGHTLIERDDELTRIDARVFREIGINKMIFLSDDPKCIVERRRNDATRDRPVPDIDRLRQIQNEALNHAAVICRMLGVPLKTFRPNQPELIMQALRE